MKIEVITTWFNESFLAPFFFRHYDFVDKINVLYDEDSTDNTLELLKENPKVSIYPFRFPDMMDDQIKVNNINNFYRGMDCDWVINVDADEFVFVTPWGDSLRKHLEEETGGNVVISLLWQMYRHVSEAALDPSMDIMQRRHGVMGSMVGQTACYDKPIVCRPGAHNGWGPGNHDIAHNTNTRVSPRRINGAHWAMADTFAIDRRIQGRKLRQSRSNLERKLTAQNHFVTEAQIRAELEAHKNDPQIF